MHVVIAGGSGFVGQCLQRKLLQSGYDVTILTRDPSKYETTERLRYVSWLTPDNEPATQLGQVDAFVNLAGESINGLRWTKSKKERILTSRVTATREVIRLIKGLDLKPRVLINASAVGIYGMSDTKTFTENSVTDANDFLATVVKTWETEAAAVKEFGVRLVSARLGIVLGGEGALPLMALPYKFGIGGTVGSGKQWLSWIHVEDVAGLIQWAIEKEEIAGPLNLTAPEPKKMEEFGRTVGQVLRRPHWIPVPSFAMKLLLGEMSSMLLSGQRAIPEKALRTGYEFTFPALDPALKEVFSTRK
ncbi:TIGR01777 family oxidoreductase [Bacillus niameyensis]|uniref:TIGR01777 family oxidoreductase n=1 Tax=Bacillus niameyensis TaxID=1522308 RepID=UPI000783C431|nr:TIGR01777 family oxidoreductase [Bacillus niameyensis]